MQGTHRDAGEIDDALEWRETPDLDDYDARGGAMRSIDPSALLSGLPWRAQLVKRLNPVKGWIRAYIRDVVLHDYLVYGDESRLHIDRTAVVNNALFNVSSGTISVKEFACLSHNVSLVTGVHDFSKLDRDRQEAVETAGRDIVIERGAWLSCNVTVLGPCTVGEHAVVGAGSVVTRDVPPMSFVAGVPARHVRPIATS